MKVTSISIKQFLGIEERSVECGKITKITGRNASGKTTILSAIQAAICGGSIAKLSNIKAEGATPELVLVLDNGKYLVEKDAKGVTVKARVGDSAAYETVKKPQSWLDGLFDAKLANPVKLLTAKPEDLADLILEALPLKLDRNALAEAIGPVGIEAAGPTLQLPGHPLQVVAAVRQAIYDTRTGVNVSARDKESSAYELSKTIPAEMPEDPAEDVRRLEAVRDEQVGKVTMERTATENEADAKTRELNSALGQATTVLDQGFKTAAAKRRHALAEAVSKLTADAEAEIATLRTETEQHIELLEAANATCLQAVAKTRTKALDLVAVRQLALDEIQGELAEARSLAERIGQITGAKKMADKFAADSASLKQKSGAMSLSLTRLDAFRRAMADDTGIEGLEIEGKAIKVNGVPFEQLNQAQRIRILVKIAVMRAKGSLPIVFVDGAEALDAEQQGLLEKELEATGVQAFISSVEDHDLTVVAG